jgi:class 3 adenylate cyclase
MPVERRRERKVVTVVFCALVGCTSREGQLDPRTSRRSCGRSTSGVRSELERHGGTVEKFIGDAVMALFGAPTAHEDDPERAVRAALAIRDYALQGGLELRVGVTTGEALVSLDANPAGGEGMAAGDVVNSAARLQTAAPVNGILVDGPTSQAARSAIAYPLWRRYAGQREGPADRRSGGDASPRSLTASTLHHARTELMGRARAVGACAFERACHERIRSGLVCDAGMGKAPRVRAATDRRGRPGLITWRQGVAATGRHRVLGARGW